MGGFADQPSDVMEVSPVVFHGHLGALHRPIASKARNAVVVVCSPVGSENLCVYRALFLWAERLAARGFYVLRYDHRGEGDSLPLDQADDQWTQWRIGLEQASEFARAVTGKRRVILSGLRIGATLAISGSEEIKPDGLILWDPLLSGDAWVRELRLVRAMLVRRADDDVKGLRLSPATIATLANVDVRALSRPFPPTFFASPAASKHLQQQFNDLETAPSPVTPSFSRSRTSASPLSNYSRRRRNGLRPALAKERRVMRRHRSFLPPFFRRSTGKSAGLILGTVCAAWLPCRHGSRGGKP